ncbi:DUF3857 domain-containing protein [Faecalibacter rhinopitheci]|uniref:DUF3857 domain-containing protein n=1 Tax=Faecalibacter rhinopitheci TaxID=2779678 RepID=A0A8J7FQJ8_9FLAO|nr:DUF3857 domain-containing protein [Faecalibacter rhinopitheci]MBF0596443.1 DUF3857 domain-containing protein [Faecalibacter rhinopitheci]
MKFYKIILFILGLISTPLLAQKSINGFPKLTEEKLTLNEVSFEKDADAVILDEEGFIEISNGGYIKTVKKRIKILTEKGINQANVELVYYAKNNHENISGIKAQTINLENGKYVSYPVDDKEIFYVNINEYYKAARFPLPNVKIGSILEYQYTIYSKSLYLIEAWDFQNELPTLKSKFNLKINAGLDFTNLLIGKRISSKYKNKKNLESWELNNIPSIKEIKYVHNVKNAAEKMRLQLAGYDSGNGYVSTISKWKELKDELVKQNESSYNLQAVKKYAETIPNGKTDSETFENVLQYFKKDFNWNGFHGIYANMSQKNILETKRANVAELNCLLSSILKQKGISSNLILLSSRANGKLITSFPYLAQFDYLVNQINLRDGSNYIVNAAELPDDEYKFAPLNLFNDYGFDISSKEDRFIQVNQFLSRVETTFQYSFPKDQIVENRKDLFDGYFYNNKRETKNILAQFIDTPLHVIKEEKEGSAAYLNKNYFIRNKAQMTFDRNEFITLENPLNALIQSYQFEEKERFENIEFDFPYYIKVLVDVEIPEGYEVIDLKEFKAIKKSSDELVYSQTYGMKGNNLQVLYELYLGQANYNASEYDFLKTFFESIQKESVKSILLKKK